MKNDKVHRQCVKTKRNYKLFIHLSMFVYNKNSICAILVEWNMSIKKVVIKNKKINIFKNI